MVNYTALNETEDSGGSECVTNSSDNGDKETNPVNIQSFINYYSISFKLLNLSKHTLKSKNWYSLSFLIAGCNILMGFGCTFPSYRCFFLWIYLNTGSWWKVHLFYKL